MMAHCQVCGEEIRDAKLIQAWYRTTPKLCEPCRVRLHKKRQGRIPAIHERLDMALVRVDWSSIKVESSAKAPDGRQYWRCYVGGRMYGPWGGADHQGKYIIMSYVRPGSSEPVLSRLMRKTSVETGEAWLYVVLQPAPDDADTDDLPVLAVHFERVWKRTLKGLGGQFDERHEPSGEVVATWLRGGSHARSRRYGNTWSLIIYVPEDDAHV